jgi:phosphoribosylaminoimidazolecarboxamide formyltransferase/IMP cyclohydrolase
MSKLALLSVSDKTGIVELARRLVDEFQFSIISSGGTAQTLKDAGLPVTKVSDYTGAPEILGGRVKTLHPRIHGGILARRNLDSDVADLEANNIQPLDLVVVNLYPFEATIAQKNCTLEDAVENIDIGGPAMLRAAAKNFAHLTVLSNPAMYEGYLQELRKNNGAVSLQFRKARAAEAFAMTNTYDQAIASYLSQDQEELPQRYGVAGVKFQNLRYGENPHQAASWYQIGTKTSGWAAATQLQGKELSYNNLIDLEAARRIIAEFPPERAAAAILKHTNPCGVALGDSLAQAYQKAFDADSVSAFGGIVALNQALDAETAQLLSKTFLECIVTPECTPEAREILGKKSNLRVLVLPDLSFGPRETVRAIAGGFLVQQSDDRQENTQDWQVVSDRQPTPEQLAEMLFAFKIVKHVKSNAIVVTKDNTTKGIGAGQMNRVGSVKIALEQAGDEAKDAILASDGFFPFDDSVRTAVSAGISAIIQPGGSIRDKDSIVAANELNLVMVLTGIRHFLH